MFEPNRSPMPVEQKVSIENLQGRGLEIDLAKIVGFKANSNRIAGTWVELQWFADNAKDGNQHTDAGWDIVAGER
jgi:hypothetical protein